MAKQPQPLHTMDQPHACGGCRFWRALPDEDRHTRRLPAGVGECRAVPPDVQVGLGPVMGYRLTLQTTAACGLSKPL